MSKWKVGSLFAGVGGFDLGFEQTGKFETAWMSEWDRHAEAVLRRRFPNAKQLGDITKVDPSQLEPVDVVVGGFPCQDLSVAGKRAGLAGERSGLFHEFVRIVRGLPRRPSFVVVENVPGMLSSQQGRDFAVVLSEVAEEWGAVSVAWRILDSQYFGVAQRRRRVFLVLDLAGERAQEVLALGEGSSRNPPSRVPAEQESPQAARGCPDGGRPCFSRHDQSGTCREVSVAPRLSGKADNCCDIPMVLEQRSYAWNNNSTGPMETDVVPLRSSQGTSGFHEMNHPMVAQTFRKSARATSASDAETWVADEYANTLNTFDVSEVRATTVAIQGVDLFNQTITGDVHVPLRTAGGHGAPAIAVSHAFYSTGGTHGVNKDEEVCPPLKVGSSVGIPSPPAVAMRSTIPIQDGREIEKRQNGLGIGIAGDPSYTIDTTGAQSVAIQGNLIGRDAGGPQGVGASTDGVMYTLTRTDVHGVAFPIDTRNAGRNPDKLDEMNRQGCGVGKDGDPAHTLSVAHVNAVATATIVRRLTPDECCVLQGFPPDWNDGQADSHRYKQMGNAVTVTVARWIAERMARFL